MDLLTDDGRAYMRERGVQHIYQDRSVLELAAMKDAYEQGMLEKFLEGGTGLMLAGPDAIHGGRVKNGRLLACLTRDELLRQQGAFPWSLFDLCAVGAF